MKNVGWSLLFLVAAVLLTVAVTVKAQQTKKVPRIGFLFGSPVSARVEAFQHGLRDLGYVEGKNIVIEWRSGEGKLDRNLAHAAELVRLQVDVIVATGAQKYAQPGIQPPQFPLS